MKRWLLSQDGRVGMGVEGWLFSPFRDLADEYSMPFPDKHE